MLDARIIATHEAGHAFVAEALGLAVSSVQVGTNPRFDLVDVPGPERRLDFARVLAAGAAGEEVIFNCKPIGGGTDDLAIAELLCTNDDEQQLRREVRLFIAANYPAVQRIASALLRDGTLNGSQVNQLTKGVNHEIIQRYLRVG